MSTWLHDLRYALRSLRRSPGFTAVAVLILALGIGANTAIFSAVKAVFLTPLPYATPDRLMFISATVRREQLERRAVSYPDFRDWREQARSFRGMAAVTGGSVILTGGTQPERLSAELVSEDYFRILGTQAIRGRTFLPEEDRDVGSAPVVLLGYGTWQQRFGGDSTIIGTTVLLNDVSYQVIGIMPEGFTGVTDDADVWLPMTMIGAIANPRFLEQRGSRGLTVIGRLTPGVTAAQAQRELDAITQQLAATYPRSNTNYGAEVIPFRAQMLGNVVGMTWMLLGAVVLVLLIVCVNIANLLLARAAARRKEIAVRLALGSSRTRLVWRLLTESVLLALAGGVIGALFAAWGVAALVRLSPASLPSFVHVRLDVPVLLFAAGLSIVTGVLFGLLPALHATRPDLITSLRESAATTDDGTRSGRRFGTRGLLVVSETALAVVLLVSAGLMLRSFQRQTAIDPGFRGDKLLVMSLQLPESRYSRDRLPIFAGQLLDRVRALPGVRSAALSTDVPIVDGYSAMYVSPPAVGSDTTQGRIRVYRHGITPGFLATMGVPLLRGRDFSVQDHGDSTHDAVIVSRKLAERAWPGENPVGRTLYWGGPGGDAVRVVGVVGDVRYRTLTADPVSSPEDPDVYFPYAAAPSRDVRLIVHSSTSPSAVAASVRQAVRDVDPSVPVFDTRTMDEILGRALSLGRFGSALLSAFGLLALLLAGMGLYAVMWYTVSQRSREMGIRMALGARRGTVLRLVVRHGLMLALTGVAIGVGVSLGATRLLSSLLYDIAPTDMPTYVGVSALLTLVALLAAAIPAYRAARVDPIIALRSE